MRAERLVMVLLALHALGCGGQSSRPGSGSGGAAGEVAASGGGTGGASAGDASPNAVADGGAAGQAAGASGSGGPGGTGGSSGASSLQPTFTILEPFRPAQPSTLTGRVPSLFVFSASDDGKVLAGGSYYPLGDHEYASGFDAVVWTRPTGLVRIGVPDGTGASDAYASQVSADGSYVFGVHYRRSESRRAPGSAGFFRWSPSSGFTTFGDLEMTDGRIVAVSRDGKVAAGYVDREDASYVWFRWTEQGGLRWLASTTPPPSEGRAIQAMSADGNVLLGWSEQGEQVAVQRWTEAGFENLGLLPGAVSCQGYQMTPDGAVILGLCTDGPELEGEPPPYNRTFRWTAGTGMVEVPVPPSNAMSSDGAVIMGAETTTLYRWTSNDLRREALPSETSETFYGLSGISQNGRVGYGYRLTNWTSSPYAPTEAFKFSENGGVETLGFLPGDVASVVSGGSSDGLVLGGSSWTAPQGSPNASSRAVVWDAAGIRAIAAELAAAGIDLTDVALSDVTTVWSGSPVVVLGTGSKGKSQIAWVATLAKRP